MKQFFKKCKVFQFTGGFKAKKLRLRILSVLSAIIFKNFRRAFIQTYKKLSL